MRGIWGELSFILMDDEKGNFFFEVKSNCADGFYGKWGK